MKTAATADGIVLNGKFARVGEPSYVYKLDSMMLHDVFLFVLFVLYFLRRKHTKTLQRVYTRWYLKSAQENSCLGRFSSPTLTTMETPEALNKARTEHSSPPSRFPSAIGF